MSYTATVNSLGEAAVIMPASDLCHRDLGRRIETTEPYPGGVFQASGVVEWLNLEEGCVDAGLSDFRSNDDSNQSVLLLNPDHNVAVTVESVTA